MNFKKMADRAHLLFEYAGWEWGFLPHQKVPGRRALHRAMCELYDTLGEKGAEQVETGRLLCIRQDEENGAQCVKMCVVLGEERWD